jgi:hypothetical protein
MLAGLLVCLGGILDPLLYVVSMDPHSLCNLSVLVLVDEGIDVGVEVGVGAYESECPRNVGAGHQKNYENSGLVFEKQNLGAKLPENLLKNSEDLNRKKCWNLR